VPLRARERRSGEELVIPFIGLSAAADALWYLIAGFTVLGWFVSAVRHVRVSPLER
jgi:hypothetical protein